MARSGRSKSKISSKRKPSTASGFLTAPLDLQANGTFAQVLELLKSKTRIDVSQYKATTVGRRIQRQMGLQKVRSLEAYLGRLAASEAAVKALSDDIFIHVTEFFRDPESFEVLKQSVFPNLIKNGKSGAPLRIWVPGCSTGEEAYSIAMAFFECAEVAKAEIPLQIFATDISELAVEKARAGQYQESDVTSLSAARIERFFDKSKETFKVKKAIRDTCIFSRHDLINNPPFAKMDLISCRNVLIYFDPVLQKQVMPIFHYALNAHGFLWLGRSESPVGISKLFTLTEKAHKIFSKLSTATPMSFRFPVNRPVDKVDTTKKAPLHDHQKEIDRIGFSRYAPAGAVINADMEIVQVRGHTGPYLELPVGQPTYNFLKMVKPELLPGMRMAIQTAQKTNAPIRKEGLSYAIDKVRKNVDVEIIPINPLAPPKERQFVIFFEEPDPKKKEIPPKLTSKKNKAARVSKDAYVTGLLQEIDSMREYQQLVSEGYESAQEELTSSNEELQSTLEEFQSTNEELETAKEEMQAANEELATVNDELLHRNDELAKSEERFRLLVEGVRDYAIFALDPKGIISSWNEGARRLNGYESSEIIGQHFSKFYLPEDLARNHPQYELEVARQIGRYEEEGWRLRKDGIRFWANVVITRIDDANGNHLGFSKVTRDLTERKAAEESLRQSEHRSRLMIQAVRDYAIFMLDPSGCIESWNEGAERLKGYSREEILGHHFSKFYLPEDIQQGHPQEELEIAKREGRYEEEGWRLRKDGSRFWANVVITRVNDFSGDHIGFTKVTRDLTQRKKFENHLKQSRDDLEIKVKERTEKLIESENQLRVFANSIPQLAWIAGCDGQVNWYNDRWFQYTGKTLAEMERDGWQGVHDPGFFPKFVEQWKRSLASGEPLDLELPLRGADGRYKWFLTRVIAARDSRGAVVSWFGTSTDIDELRKIRMQLAGSLKVRDEFLSIASHELKTPLTSLKLQLQLTDRSTQPERGLVPSAEELSHSLKLALRQVDSLTDLVENLLDISRIRTGRFLVSASEVDLSELVRNVVSQCSQQLNTAGIRLDLQLEDEVIGQWDQRRLEQVVVNLVSNAIKYAPKSTLRMSTGRKSGYACFSVEDSGPGIAEDRLPKIFERFERAGAEKNVAGLGLGLFIVKEIIEAHHGKISVTSELQKGTRFYIELPNQPDLSEVKDGEHLNGR